MHAGSDKVEFREESDKRSHEQKSKHWLSLEKYFKTFATVELNLLQIVTIKSIKSI